METMPDYQEASRIDPSTAPARLHRRTEGSPLPTALIDGETQLVRDANPAFCTFIQRDYGDLPGKRITSLLGNAVRLKALLDRVSHLGATDFEADLAFAGGAEACHGTVIVTPILLDERRGGLVVQIIDTTELVESRAFQAEALRDLKEANEKLLIAGIREQDLADRARSSEAEVKALLARESFLARASTLLSSSLDQAATLQQVARLLVPQLADWCVVDLVAAGSPYQFATAHANPETEHLLRDLGNRRLTEVDLPFGVGRVLGTGRSELCSDVSHPDRVAEALGVEDPAVIRHLGARSYMCVPLKARDEVIGVLSLVCSESGRCSRQEDLDVAEELARRSSWAIDNARLYQEAQAAISSRDDVLSVVSHDLRNPLYSMMMSAQALLTLLSADESAKKLRGPVELIRRAGEHMNRLIDELVELASIQAGRLALECCREANFTALIQEALEMMDARARQKSVRLETEVSGEDSAVSCDKERIIRVVENLVGNAIKFSPDNARVLVTIRYLSAEVYVSVSDAGPGIAEDDVPRLFDAYWKGQRTGRKGTGLGLYISKAIVEAHGGRIWVESKLGVGSTFHFAIPKEDGEGARAAPR